MFGNPLHPYTKMLLASVPQLHKKWADVEREIDPSGPEELDARRLVTKAGEAGPRPEPERLVAVDDDHFVTASVAGSPS